MRAGCERWRIMRPPWLRVPPLVGAVNGHKRVVMPPEGGENQRAGREPGCGANACLPLTVEKPSLPPITTNPGETGCYRVCVQSFY